MKPIVWIHTRQGPNRSCPICFCKLDGQTQFMLDRPEEEPRLMEPGDLTKCAYCGTFLVLEEVGFRLAEPRDLDHIPPLLRDIAERAPLMGKQKKPN